MRSLTTLLFRRQLLLVFLLTLDVLFSNAFNSDGGLDRWASAPGVNRVLEYAINVNSSRPWGSDRTYYHGIEHNQLSVPSRPRETTSLRSSDDVMRDSQEPPTDRQEPHGGLEHRDRRGELVSRHLQLDELILRHVVAKRTHDPVAIQRRLHKETVLRARRHTPWYPSSAPHPTNAEPNARRT